MMFENFFLGWQQDIKLAMVPPVLCAIFRLLFIYLDGPKKLGQWDKGQLRDCFAYGFWWGMDIHSRYYLLSLVLATLPGAVFPAFYVYGSTVRLVLFTIYAVAIYAAFIGRRIYWYHFHDVYNRNMWLGKNADKRNLLDIFFNQNHGALLLLSLLPVTALAVLAGQAIMNTPLVPWLQADNAIAQYGANTLMFLASIAIYYWFNFGGTFRHRLKPEWDEVPPNVKNDAFLGKATMDDFVNLKIIFKHPVPEFMDKSDEEAAKGIKRLAPGFQGEPEENPLEYFKHEAKGAKITKPRHIFFVLEESHCQAIYDDIYSMLHITKYTKALRAEKDAVVFNNFQPAGLISQTALSGLLLGFYDCDIELNENKDMWQADLAKLPTALGAQLQRLGYKTHFWYGGSLNWGSLMHFTPAIGFDQSLGGPEYCPEDAPQTWLGVYDHIFLAETAKKIIAEDKGEYEFHFVYTTSNHGPYNLPYEEMGITEQEAVPELAGSLKQGDGDMRRFAGILYADKAVADFVKTMRDKYPDSLFILSSDHASAQIPVDKGILPRRDKTLREHLLTSFSMHHPELKQQWFSGDADKRLGEHLSILPTIMELIAPQGFTYYSLKPSLFEAADHVVTPYSWMNHETLGFYKDMTSQQLAASDKDIPMAAETAEYLEERTSLQDITAWMVKHPEVFVKEKQ